MKIISGTEIFFRGQLFSKVGDTVKIGHIRYSFIEQAFEANRIFNLQTGILFETEWAQRPYELSWRDAAIWGELSDVVITGNRSLFRIVNPRQENTEPYYYQRS